MFKALLESFHEARESTRKYRESIPRATQSAHDQNMILLTAEYWDEWTGARYQRVRNPTIAMTTKEWYRSTWSDFCEDRPEVELGTVVRSCAVTGDWHKL